MTDTWNPNDPGVLRLPSGRLIRGRGLRHPLPTGAPTPSYGVYLLGRRPPDVSWDADWIRWPDFRLPVDRVAARAVLAEVWRRADGERVEVACGGGRGRTGTALACVAVLDGVPAGEAVAYVRAHYDRRAVETPWQRRYVRRFGVDSGAAGAEA
ncbi:protein phosphatase [Streptomyces sp. NPDC005492]|uniref:protein-tyrosine phosphatase family protein n=1 Tax=Streptomyces sp. NPDC005492 TaxID=3156883 RepID=UPI0033AD574D